MVYTTCTCTCSFKMCGGTCVVVMAPPSLLPSPPSLPPPISLSLPSLPPSLPLPHFQTYGNPATPGGSGYDNTASPLVPESPGSSRYGTTGGHYGSADYMTPSPGIRSGCGRGFVGGRSFHVRGSGFIVYMYVCDHRVLFVWKSTYMYMYMYVDV